MSRFDLKATSPAGNFDFNFHSLQQNIGESFQRIERHSVGGCKAHVCVLLDLGGNAMKLEDLPIGAIDWSCIPAVVHAGENGTAAARSRILGGITLRVVVYSGGYMADHWCAKGHIIHVISGSLVIEHEDETRTTVSTGMS